MRTISSCVEDILSSQPFLQEALYKRIINFSALAEDMQPEIAKILKKDVKVGAIMMALRRYDFSNVKKHTSSLNLILEQLGDITVRSNLCDFTFYNSKTISQSQSNLINTLTETPKVFYAFTSGVNESNLIISKSEKSKVDHCFKDETLTNFKEKLSAISLMLPTKNLEVPGLYYQIFKRLAWAQVSVYEVVSTTNEITVVMENKFVDKAFSVIKTMTSQKS